MFHYLTVISPTPTLPEGEGEPVSGTFIIFISSFPPSLWEGTGVGFLLIRSLSLQVIQDDLAHTHALGSHLYVLIFLDVFQCLLQ